MKLFTKIISGIAVVSLLFILPHTSIAQEHAGITTPLRPDGTPQYVILQDIGKAYKALAQEQTELVFAEHARLLGAAYTTTGQTLQQAMSTAETLEQLMIDISTTQTGGVQTLSVTMTQRIHVFIRSVDQLLDTGAEMETALTGLSSFETMHQCGVPKTESTLYVPTCSKDLQKSVEDIRASLAALEAMKLRLSQQIKT